MQQYIPTGVFHWSMAGLLVFTILARIIKQFPSATKEVKL
jgi:hypothetical protein